MANIVQIDMTARDETRGVLGGVRGALSNIFQTAAGFLAAHVFEKIGSEIVGFARDSIGAASDLNETVNKTQEVFKDSSDGIMEWSKNSATAVGLSQKAALDAASGFGIFGKAAGLAGDDLSNFAEQGLGLAADFASFFNTSVEDASTAIQAAFRGETEPIRRYGILLDDATMRQEALKLGIVSTTKDALTPQQKILAANALIFEQSKDAQGDFIRTSDGLANSQRILAAQIENAKASLGQAFLPIVTEVVGFLNREGMPVLLNVIDTFKGMISSFSISGNPLSGLKETFMGLLEPVLSVGNTFMGFFGWLGDWWATFGGPIITDFQQMGQSASEAFGKIVADVQPFIYEILQRISGWMVENGPLIQQTVQVIADNFTDVLMPAVLAAWNVIKPILSGLVDLILGGLRMAMQLLTGDWQGAWDTLVGTVGNVGNALVEAVTNLLYGIVELFGGNLDQILDNVAKWIVNVILKFEALKNGIVEKVKAFTDAGRQIVEGIKTGISNAWNSLVSWFTDKISSMVSTVTSALGIHSPSAVFADIGQNIMAGLGQGLQNSSSIPVNAMAGIAPAMTSAVGGGSGGRGISIVLQINTPVNIMDENKANNVLLPMIINGIKTAQAQGVI